MKNILKLFFFVFAINSSFAQTFDIMDYQNLALNINGAYYQDMNFELNPFEGTYIYTNGQTTLKVVLVKKINSFDGRNYEDLIIGEYQYIENGIEKINTLSNLSQNYTNQGRHSIHGNTVLLGKIMGCFDCDLTEKRLSASLVENSTDNWAQISIRRKVVNGNPAIELFVWWQLKAKELLQPNPPHASFPGGTYTLIKQ